MGWQTRLPTTGRKRPNDAALHEFRARQSQSPAQLSVSHAEASGASRMLTGSVGGDNVHGNVSHVTNYYNSHETPGGLDMNDPDSYHNYSSVLSDSEKENLFKTLYFPQLDSRLTNLKRAGRRTCEWLLRRQDYQRWMNMDSKHLQAEDGLFWIRGNPGTGKSIAMKFLFQRMQQKLKRSRDKLVLSFFFNARGSDLEKSTLGLYRSLLFGLISSDQSLLDALDHCSRSQYLSILSGEWEQKHEPLLQELCEKAVELLSERGKMLYFYVDALDECPECQIRDMVVYFESLMAEGISSNICVCFSSRHYPRISIKTKSVCPPHSQDFIKHCGLHPSSAQLTWYI